MTDLRAAAEQALEALEWRWISPAKAIDIAKETLRQALAQPEQEPEQGCAECGKKASDGWALYCVKCTDEILTKPQRNGWRYVLRKEGEPVGTVLNVQWMSNTGGWEIGFHSKRKLFKGEALYTAPQEPWDTSDMAHRSGGLSMDQEPFKPDWDMIAPFYERIKELEIDNEKLRRAIAQPEQEADEWYEKALWGEKQEPVAWVRDLTSPQPHCVTSIKYLSIADTDAGVKYIPVYTAPPIKQEPVTWRNAAIRLGEDLYSVGPDGYYDMTAEQWLDWALSVVTAPLSKHKEQE